MYPCSKVTSAASSRATFAMYSKRVTTCSRLRSGQSGVVACSRLLTIIRARGIGSVDWREILLLLCSVSACRRIRVGNEATSPGLIARVRAWYRTMETGPTTTRLRRHTSCRISEHYCKRQPLNSGPASFPPNQPINTLSETMTSILSSAH